MKPTKPDGPDLYPRDNISCAYLVIMAFFALTLILTGWVCYAAGYNRGEKEGKLLTTPASLRTP